MCDRRFRNILLFLLNELKSVPDFTFKQWTLVYSLGQLNVPCYITCLLYVDWKATLCKDKLNIGTRKLVYSMILLYQCSYNWSPLYTELPCDQRDNFVVSDYYIWIKMTIVYRKQKIQGKFFISDKFITMFLM